jgi:hypothetical protein
MRPVAMDAFARLLLLSLLCTHLPRPADGSAYVVDEALPPEHALVSRLGMSIGCPGDDEHLVSLQLGALGAAGDVHRGSLAVGVVAELCALGVPVMQQGVQMMTHTDAAGSVLKGVQLPEAMWHTLAAAHGDGTLAVLARRLESAHMDIGLDLQRAFVEFGSRKHLRLQWAAVGVHARPMVHFVHENTVSKSMHNFGEWEGLQTEFLQALLRPGDVAVDVSD